MGREQGPLAEEGRWPRECGKGREVDSPRKPPEDQPLDWFPASGLQECKRYVYAALGHAL